ncbi:DUF6468 domain-containing protein [Mariluticola halotolerans]|uniref:DUF6468 domain-containing protein n=1 Tax=Mariluticola halotolerans TaxID=2909283 RepID=UPI0026E46873|nr:DUF6468 domain-containing protein [Mariluticola halotolerans]UJQ95414.1 DUF6468 domain-containing protein [Mariluticola halotolerans]
MSSLPFGIIVESAVAVLLMLTIGYCILLNDRLKKLHADRDALKQMIGDLIRATDMANSAIKGLREAATEADATLTSRMEEADRFAVELANHVTAGRTVMDRIARVTDTVRRNQAPAAPAPQAQVKAPLPGDGPIAPSAKGAQAALERLAAHQRRRESAA